MSGCDIFQAILEKYPFIKAFSADTSYKNTSVKYVLTKFLINDYCPLFPCPKDPPLISNLELAIA